MIPRAARRGTSDANDGGGDRFRLWHRSFGRSAAARVSERTNDGDEDDEDEDDADEDDDARRGLGRGGDGAFDGRAVARELMGSYAESDSGVTTTSESARGVRGPSPRRRRNRRTLRLGTRSNASWWGNRREAPGGTTR